MVVCWWSTRKSLPCLALPATISEWTKCVLSLGCRCRRRCCPLTVNGQGKDPFLSFPLPTILATLDTLLCCAFLSPLCLPPQCTEGRQISRLEECEAAVLPLFLRSSLVLAQAEDEVQEGDNNPSPLNNQ